MNEILLIPFFIALWVAGYFCWLAAQDEPDEPKHGDATEEVRQ